MATVGQVAAQVVNALKQAEMVAKAVDLDRHQSSGERETLLAHSWRKSFDLAPLVRCILDRSWKKSAP
jgi:hypothetical protein